MVPRLAGKFGICIQSGSGIAGVFVHYVMLGLESLLSARATYEEERCQEYHGHASDVDGHVDLDMAAL